MAVEHTLSSNPNDPSFVFDDLPFPWQMTRCEKFGLAALLAQIRPELAIEVGTYKGGSLQVIAKYAKRVYSLDISPDCGKELSPHFHNVEFLTGDSKELLPTLLHKISENRERLGFVLIDGDHSTAAVRSDLNAVLDLVPVCPLYVVCHDSFHPPCRNGILQAEWTKNPFVRYVEIDFVPGVFHYEAFDTAEPRSMYGGLCLALLLPEKHQGAVKIHQSQKSLFDAVYARSRYSSPLEKVKASVKSLKARLG